MISFSVEFSAKLQETVARHQRQLLQDQTQGAEELLVGYKVKAEQVAGDDHLQFLPVVQRRPARLRRQQLCARRHGRLDWHRPQRHESSNHDEMPGARHGGKHPENCCVHTLGYPNTSEVTSDWNCLPAEQNVATTKTNRALADREEDDYRPANCSWRRNACEPRTAAAAIRSSRTTSTCS
ncbi:hypothetical protein LSTR_LSTR017216 [Laodelphax striatellus]|uniref:Uncharacterized protein n=1 Tax=Laodelphax striatellus TaxID=195883 RepID=A0A482WEX5_LAOST|nr:hypothetical protein LSTR_LSTR017216 [Laodelphax striatellus]